MLDLCWFLTIFFRINHDLSNPFKHLVWQWFIQCSMSFRMLGFTRCNINGYFKEIRPYHSMFFVNWGKTSRLKLMLCLRGKTNHLLFFKHVRIIPDYFLYMLR